VQLDEQGWIEITTLLTAIQKQHPDFTRERLLEIVETNEKKRFALSPDGLRIRASQGHSIGVELGLQPVIPPEILYLTMAPRTVI